MKRDGLMVQPNDQCVIDLRLITYRYTLYTTDFFYQHNVSFIGLPG